MCVVRVLGGGGGGGVDGRGLPFDLACSTACMRAMHPPAIGAGRCGAVRLRLQHADASARSRGQLSGLAAGWSICFVLSAGEDRRS